jgi:uncharacterized protein (DUF2132 family)
MTAFKSKDPLHGVTLEMIVKHLVDVYGWEALGKDLKMRCFQYDASVKSCLTFLRKTPWARKKVEDLYAGTVKVEAKYCGEPKTDRPE